MGAIWAVLGGAVGAGFASGREIMQFFGQYGPYSWALCVLSAAGMGRMMESVMMKDEGRRSRAFRALMILMLTAVGGGMTAAAGELAALTLPVHHARSLGALGTLAACVLLSRRSLPVLTHLGRVLLPLTALAFLLCLSVGTEEDTGASVSLGTLPGAAVRAVGYAGMNAALVSGVLRDAGEGRTARQKKAVAWGAAALLLLLLLLGNAAMARKAAELKNAALPTVLLLRDYGKTGYVLAAGMLYLAMFSTLIAVLRGLRLMLPVRHGCACSALLAAGASLCGFEGIVAAAYPALGWGWLLLSADKRRIQRTLKGIGAFFRQK